MWVFFLSLSLSLFLKILIRIHGFKISKYLASNINECYFHGHLKLSHLVFQTFEILHFIYHTMELNELNKLVVIAERH